jgi:OmpA-OmpF porin, OOP family
MSFRLIGRMTTGSLMFVLLACQSSVSSSGGADQPAPPEGQTSAPPVASQPAPTAPGTYPPPATDAPATGSTTTPAPAPSTTPAQTAQPAPTTTPAPTALPSTLPTTIPTALPTTIPTTFPTAIPTALPPQTPPATEPAPATGAKVRTEGDRILLPGNVVFDTGKAVLSNAPENQTILNQLKQFLVDNPKVTTVRIEGYTDNVGQAGANLKLSGERALAIKQWLIGAGIAAERVIAVGFGQEKPIADNASSAGRAQNRRTEFKIATVNKRPYRGVPVNGGGTEFK